MKLYNELPHSLSLIKTLYNSINFHVNVNVNENQISFQYLSKISLIHFIIGFFPRKNSYKQYSQSLIQLQVSAGDKDGSNVVYTSISGDDDMVDSLELDRITGDIIITDNSHLDRETKDSKLII